MSAPSEFGESEIHRRVREAEEERETGWHAGGGRPFGHPDDVISPYIRALQLVGIMQHDTRPRPLWFRVTKVFFVGALLVGVGGLVLSLLYQLGLILFRVLT
jgi:hypothetical protein